MNHIAKTGILLLTVLISIGTVSAYDADNPYTNIVQWVIPDDTVFVVTFPSGESLIDFDDNVTGQNNTLIEPDGQNAAASDPIISINNTGNVVQTFSMNITNATGKPSFATSLKIGNTTDHGAASEINVSAIAFATAISPIHETNLYIWCNTTSATQGTTQRQFMISSEETP